MGADIKSLRNRIRSVDSTLHLTKAMGLVAASKIRRATREMNRTREYAAAMQDVVDVLRAAPECERSPFMQPSGKGTRLIVIAGDRGLAGGYNANVFRLAATLPEAEVIAGRATGSARNLFPPNGFPRRRRRNWRTGSAGTSWTGSSSGWASCTPGTNP